MQGHWHTLDHVLGKCFNKYGVDVAIKKCETVFDKVRNKNIEKIPVLQRSGIYKFCLLYTSILHTTI